MTVLFKIAAVVAASTLFLGCTTAPTKVQMEVVKSSAWMFVPPASNVPASCAGFLGVWAGYWPGYGETWLWVVEVDANCVAKCMNNTPSAVPSRFQSCDIKNNVLERQKSDGAEYYEHRGDELGARYVYSGGQNATVFRKLKPGEK